MNLCIPVTEDRGMESPVCAHFGSAPIFLIVDTESEAYEAIPNEDHRHGHGMCQPLAILAGRRLDGIVVGGIGRRALEKTRAASLTVYLAEDDTVRETLEAFRKGSLQLVTPETACAGHGHHRE